MSIQLDYTVPSTGALSSYHTVNVVTLNYDGAQSTMATVASYVSKDTRASGKQAMYQQQIQLDGLPDADPRAFCEAALVAAKPTGGSADAFPIRYTFAGGTIVD